MKKLTILIFVVVCIVGLAQAGKVTIEETIKKYPLDSPKESSKDGKRDDKDRGKDDKKRGSRSRERDSKDKKSDSREKYWKDCKDKKCEGGQVAVFHKDYRVCYCDCINTDIKNKCMDNLSYTWNDDSCKCTEKDSNKMGNDFSKTLTDSTSTINDIFINLIKTLLSEGTSKFQDNTNFIKDL